jgi:hypothetical protein
MPGVKKIHQGRVKQYKAAPSSGAKNTPGAKASVGKGKVENRPKGKY